MSVTIIIPVLGPYSEFCACITSLQKHTDLKANTLMAVGDTDKYAQHFSFLPSDATTLHIKESFDFAHVLNRAIQNTETDVVILNADTILTQSWLEKLLACALSNKNIATICPYSSFNIMEPDKICDYAQIAESAAVKAYPSIPNTLGVCTYIRRDAFDAVGGFCANTFGGGYGENSDFCQMVSDIGYINVLCEDTVIHCTKSISFSCSAPQHSFVSLPNPDIFGTHHPLCLPQDMIRLVAILQNKKKTILQVVSRSCHEDAIDNLGGTQMHVKDLLTYFKDSETFNIIELGMDNGFVRVTVYSNEDRLCFFFKYTQNDTYSTFFTKELSDIFATVLDGFGVDIVHVHHTLHLSLDIYYLAKDRGLPLFASLHDYYIICPFINLVDYTGVFCLLKNNIPDCDTCIRNRSETKNSAAYIHRWRKEHQTALLLCDKIFAPSDYVPEVIGDFFPDVAKKIEVIPHGVNLPICDIPTKLEHPHAPLRVAFLGALFQRKGSRLAYELMCSDAPDIDWYTIGLVGDEDILQLNKSNVHHLGSYQRADLPRIFAENSIDLVLLFSIFPETFSYTLSESLACFIPTVCTDIGALGQRSRAMDCGWILSSSPNSEEVLHTLRHISANPDEYARVLQNVHDLHMKTIDEMCAEYMVIYNNIPPATHTPAIFTKNLAKLNIYNALKYAVLKEPATNHNDCDAKILSLESEISNIKNSITFRLLSQYQNAEQKLKTFFTKK